MPEAGSHAVTAKMDSLRNTAHTDRTLGPEQGESRMIFLGDQIPALKMPSIVSTSLTVMD